MKILNLANEGTGTFGEHEDDIKTDIRFKIKNFPDGQKDQHGQTCLVFY